MGWIAAVLTLLGLLLWQTAAGAQALRFQPQGARAVGQGNAFAAQADDPSAIQYNPAGLTQVEGIQSVLGTNLLGGSVKYKSPTGVDSRGDFNGSVNWPPPSNFYLSANLATVGLPLLSSVTAGIGLASPFGLNTRYPLDGPFRTAVTSAALPLLAIQPTIAYKINDQLSVGVSADIYTFASFLGEGHVEQKQVSAGTLGIPAGAPIELNGTGTGAGVTASMLYAPLRNEAGKPIVSIGLVYRSQAVLPLKGVLLVNGAKVADASTDLVLPQKFTGAVAIWPVRTSEREWKVELDVEYVGWSLNKHLDVRLSNGAAIPQPQQWKNVTVIAVGTEYKWLNPRWMPYWEIAARSGYTYTEDPVPDRTFNPGIISLPAHTLSLGVGFLCKGAGRFLGLIPCSGESALWPKGIGLDLAYQEWFYESRTVVGNLNPTVDGTYHAFVHLGTFSLRYLF
ncbi:MAG: outer membrane protein transport protein [Nitrospira sp.]|nr:outer membrane protein transport protein [Nitrospira sp.]MDH4368240.1 outer membrane protein transport protein [Nitrospira sp.]MDH5347368.1 outer membrane protein transport protein [Nitrospira sp.]MDH5495852.1 outer membrane protein transport protein [Nitrospira sp.]MDH5726101.1 outer membrane protein transport protein [Nitrospira sp.]